MHVDKEDYVWFPATITLPKQGMVFIDGTSTTDWKWTAVKAVKRTKKEKKALGRRATDYKMDMENAKHFGPRDFMDALDEIGFFNMK